MFILVVNGKRVGPGICDIPLGPVVISCEPKLDPMSLIILVHILKEFERFPKNLT